MISLLLLILTLLLSMIFIRIGAIALELTGLPEEQAGFQSLSAFSGTGYTTKEAEYILNHPERRRIIKILIISGSVGIVTTFAAVGGALISAHSVPWATGKLLLIITGFVLLLRAMSRPSLGRVLRELISVALLKGKIVRPVSFEEVLVNGNGFGVFQVEVTAENPLAGKSLREARLDEREVRVLYVNRASESINFPSPDFRLQEGDIIAVFGPVAAIGDSCCDLQLLEKEEKDAALLPGTPAPDFTLRAQDGREVRLSEFAGRKNVILVFYPKDKSFLCTAQLRDLSEGLSEFAKQDAEVLAVNQESQMSHAGFCDASGLKFPLLADTGKDVSRAYKTLVLGGLLVERTVYIIDKSGRIRYAKRGKPPVNELLGVLKAVNERAGGVSAARKQVQG